MSITSAVSSTPDSIQSIAYIVKLLERHVPVFFLVFARVFGMTLQAPFFSGKSLPAQVRAAFITGLVIMYMIVVNPKVDNIPTNMFFYTFMMVEEVLVGVAFGFCVSIMVSAIQAAGEIIDVQMGMSMVTLFNPMTKSQSSAMGRLFYQLELTVFILANGHLFLLSAFFQTFELLPIGGFNFNNPAVMTQFIQIVGQLFYVSLNLALPVLITLFIIDFSLGITNKVSPQINVLELNFAMKPTTGMIILLILMSTFIHVLGERTDAMIKDGVKMIKVMSLHRPKPENKNPFDKMKKNIIR